MNVFVTEGLVLFLIFLSTFSIGIPIIILLVMYESLTKIKIFFAIPLLLIGILAIIFGLKMENSKYYVTTGLEKKEIIYPFYSLEHEKLRFTYDNNFYDANHKNIRNFESDSALMETGIIVYYKQRIKLFGIFSLYKRKSREKERPYLFSAKETPRLKSLTINKKQVELKSQTP